MRRFSNAALAGPLSVVVLLSTLVYAGLVVAPLALAQIGSPPAAAPAQGVMTFHIDEAVSSRDQELIRTGIRLAADYLDEAFGGRTRGPILVTISADQGASRPAAAGHGRIAFHTTHPYWQQAPEWRRAQLAAHEYVHSLQLERGCAANTATPLWLVEGTAELVSFHVVIHGGLMTAEQARTYNVAQATTEPPLTPLRELARHRPEASEVYALYALAVEHLAARDGLLSLRQFCETVAAGQPWSEAFASAFGPTPEAFFEEFERYRQKLAL